MNTPLPALFLALLPGVSVLAQVRYVVPKSMDGVEGIGGSSQPFGYSQPIRYMCIYNGEELPFTGPTYMKGLYLRAEHSTVSPNDIWAQKQYLTVSLLISTSQVRAESPSTKFGDNHGPDLSIVIANVNIALPYQPTTLGTNGVPPPRPFNVPLLFSTPTFFDMTPIRTPYGKLPKSLVVDLLISLQPSGAYQLDSPLVCSSRIRWFGKQGPRCVTSPHHQPLDISCDDSLKAGGTVTLTINEIPPSNPFAVILGSSDTGTWKGQPVPVDLSPIGGHDCYINLDWLHSWIGQADAQGQGRISVPIPSARFVVGLELFTQAVCQDISANPLLYSTSLGLRSTVCGPLGVVRLSYLGSITNQTGSLSYGACMIFEVK